MHENDRISFQVDELRNQFRARLKNSFVSVFLLCASFFRNHSHFSKKMLPSLKKFLKQLLALLLLLQVTYGLEVDIKIDEDQSLEREGNHTQISKTFDWEKPSIDDIKLNYPEIKPGRPITVSLVLGVAFLVITITPFLLYSVYLLLTPAPLRPNFRVRRSLRQKRQQLHYDPTSWYGPNEYNSIHAEVTRSECVEKILCRIGQRANQFGVESWLNTAVERFSSIRPSWRSRMHRGMSLSRGHCNFHCDLLHSVLSDAKKIMGLPSGKPDDESSQYLDSSY